MKEKNRQKREHKSLDYTEVCCETTPIDKPFRSDINSTNKHGETLLTMAIIERNIKTVIELVGLCAAINTTNKDDHSPLALCVLTKQRKLFSVLKENGAKFSGGNDAALMDEALSDYDKKMLEIAIENGCNVNHVKRKGRFPLTEAVKSGSLEKVNLLLKHSANPNQIDGCDNFPLTEAVYRYNLIFQQDVAVSTETKTNTTTSLSKIPEIIDLLLINGASLSYTHGEDFLPLIQAVRAENEPLVKQLLSAGANVNQPNRSGHYALIETIIEGNLNILSLLIAGGADVNREDFGGRLPIIEAVITGNREMVEVLLQNEADCNKTNREFKSPFIKALCFKNTGLYFAKRMLLGGKVNLGDQFALSSVYLPIKRFQYLLNLETNPFKRLSDDQFAISKLLYHLIHRHPPLGRHGFIESEKWKIILRECGQVTLYEKENPLFLELLTCRSFKKAFASSHLTVDLLIKDYTFRGHPRVKNYASGILDMLVQLITLGTAMSSFDVSRSWSCAESDCLCTLLREELEMDNMFKEKLSYHGILRRPISLQRNCRNAVRKALLTNCVNKVKYLPLPTKMKQFLVFDGEI